MKKITSQEWLKGKLQDTQSKAYATDTGVEAATSDILYLMRLEKSIAAQKANIISFSTFQDNWKACIPSVIETAIENRIQGYREALAELENQRDSFIAKTVLPHVEKPRTEISLEQSLKIQNGIEFGFNSREIYEMFTSSPGTFMVMHRVAKDGTQFKLIIEAVNSKNE